MGAQNLNPKKAARAILTFDENEARDLLRSYSPVECAELIESLAAFLLNPEACLIGATLKNIPLSFRSIIRKLLQEFPYAKEQQVLQCLEDRDADLAEELKTILPELWFLHLLHHEAKSFLFGRLDPATLLNLRALFVYPTPTQTDSNEERNFSTYFQRHLSGAKQREIQRLLPQYSQLPSDADATTAVANFRTAILQVEGQFSDPYGKTGGHPDPDVATYAFRVVIVPDGGTFIGTIPDVPEISVRGINIRVTLKMVGDKLAEYCSQRLREGSPLPRPKASSTHVAVAILEEKAWNHWHPTIDHIADHID